MPLQLTDTHCHIHESSYADQAGAYVRAIEKGVTRMICVGTDLRASREAVAFAADHDGVWASLGLHPHDAKADGVAAVEHLAAMADVPHVVAIGECGLDYFYDNSPRDDQIVVLRAQIELALAHNLPMIFHVREAFSDFWPIFDSYSGIRGVLHSFTDTADNMRMAVERGLFIGVNGIATFTKSAEQRAMYAAIPLENLLLETDAPFLTPVPLRGTVNEPAFVTHVAQCMADLRTTTLEELSAATSQNATRLFSL